MAKSREINQNNTRYSKKFIDNLDKNLLFAYRKVKVDLFYSSIPARRNLIEYEENLLDNLTKLKEALLSNKLNEYLNSKDKAFGFFLIPKKINYDDSITEKNKNIFYFDPQKRYESQKVSSYDFRLLADVSIDFHVITTLWIICVGEKLEKNLSDSVYANRIRRTYDKNKKINLNSLGTFGPYNHAYKSWRDNALNTIKKELEHKQDVVAVTGDIKGFYHCLSPEIILEDEIYYPLHNNQNYSKDEKCLTTAIVYDVLLPWSQKTPLKKGLPVGCSISAVIANLALVQFDDTIEKRLQPCYYGRYVDDIILIIKNSDKSTNSENDDDKIFSNSNDIWEWIIKRCNKCIFRNKDISSDNNIDHIYINLLPNCDPFYWENMEFDPSHSDALVMEKSKTKIFMFDTTYGLDSIKVLEHQIQEQASEWRSIPDLDNIENTLTKIISLDDETGEQADNLRKINNLSQKRNSFSIFLRNIQSFIRNVDNSYKNYLDVFWETVEKHYYNITSFFDYFEYFPRIISIAISIKKYSWAVNFIDFLLNTSRQLWAENREKCKIALCENESLEKKDYNALEKYIKFISRESIECALYETSQNEFEISIDENVKSIFRKELQINTDIFKEYFKRDLAYWPQRHVYFSNDLTPPGNPDLKNINENDYEFLIDKKYLLCYDIDTQKKLYAFYNNLKSNYDIEQSIELTNDSEIQIPISWIFPTRPFSFEDLLLICPQLLKRTDIFKKLLTFFRGTSTKDDYWEIKTYEGKDGVPHSIMEVFKGEEKPGKVTVALASWKTTDKDWEKAVKGTSSFSPARINHLFEFIDQVINSKKKNKINIDYLIFPELSLPSKYFFEIANELKKYSISLITGLEYIHVNRRYVINSVWCSLISWPKSGKRKSSFIHYVPICQIKTRPAPHEKDELENLGKKMIEGINLPRYKWLFAKRPLIKRYLFTAGNIITHGAFSFGILICSELTNIDYRAMLRGKVDAIIIPEYNQAVEQFSSIVESTAYDVHAYIVQCNNRLYGDTRVRYPANEYYMRDLVKVKGSIEDFYIITELDIFKLRKFQSDIIRAKTVKCKGKVFTIADLKKLLKAHEPDFKPIPDGFEIDKSRKI